jgi:cyanophycinase
MRWPLLLAACLGACAAPQSPTSLDKAASPAAAAAPKGQLLIVGGGGTSDEMLSRALALARGPATRILVLPQASSLEDRGKDSAEMWRKLGAQSVELLDPLAPSSRAAIERADLIWFPGGDQNKLMESLSAAGLVDAIAERYREGATVGGTSAGAAVMSQVMLTGDADLEAIKTGATKTAPGLGLWPEVIVDQHFVVRRRMNRLISAVLERPELVGVGIDERTAVLCSGGSLQVLGEGSVVVLDARTARVEPSSEGERCAGREIRMHVLRGGDRFALQ